MQGGYRAAIEDYKRVAKLCIEDRADVIITGCGLLAPMLTQSGVTELEQVPLIDPMLVCLKRTEALADFAKAGIKVKNGAEGSLDRPPARSRRF